MNTDINAPSYRHSGQPVTSRVDQAQFDEGLRQHMLRVYSYMGLGLVMTGLVAVVVGTTPALYVPIFSTPLKWVVILTPLAFAFFFAFRIQSMSASAAQALFWAFCAIMGLSLASISWSSQEQASRAPFLSQLQCSAPRVCMATRRGATFPRLAPSLSWA
jgi:FtsH-binding integral membrane protein